MDNVEFDFDELRRYMELGIIKSLADSTGCPNAGAVLKVFVNNGVPLATAIKILTEMAEIGGGTDDTKTDT